MIHDYHAITRNYPLEFKESLVSMCYLMQISNRIAIHSIRNCNTFPIQMLFNQFMI